MTCDRCGSDDLTFSDALDVWLFICNHCGAVVGADDEQLEETHELA